MRFEAIVIGVSAGGMSALRTIFSLLPLGFPTPIIVVQHVGARTDSQWISFLNNKTAHSIQEAEEKEPIVNGNIYIAPANYHLMIERDKTFSLTIDERVCFARPSIDVLFESAAEAYKSHLIGIVLTGSNNDGTNGIKRIGEYGGLTIVQDPATAEASYMPQSAIDAIKPDYIATLQAIPGLLIEITSLKSSPETPSVL